MVRENVVADGLEAEAETGTGTGMDALDQACIALNLTDDQCSIIREAAEEVCREKRRKGRRGLSEYQLFLSKCMKEKNIKKFGEASKAMKECVSEWRRKR
jgi:hypothetical protein